MNWRDDDNQDYRKNFLLSGWEQKRYFGLYKAKVLNNHEEKEGNEPLEREGRIEVYIPELMMDIEETVGIYAYPVFLYGSQNTSKVCDAGKLLGNKITEGSDTKEESGTKVLGEEVKPQPHQSSEEMADGKQDPNARKDQKVYDDFGSFAVPARNAFILVMFEDGDPNQCRYLPFGINSIKHTTIQEVKNKCSPEKEFYLMKTPHGHRILLSDNNERLMLRSYINFFLEVNEHKDRKNIELWAPREDAPKPFGSDKGPIGEGFEAAEDEQGQPRENKDNNEDETNEDNALGGGKGGQKGSWVNKGGQESTIRIKGGNGIRGSERTKDPDMKIGQEDPKDRVKYLAIDEPDSDQGGIEDEVDQKGDPLKGYRVELCTHDDKKFIQMQTDENYLFFMNTHDDDRFIKVLTSTNYRFEMNEHDDKKYIQLQTPAGSYFYINDHDDDKFIKMQTPTEYRFEMNEHEDKKYAQVQLPEGYVFYMNAHEDDGFIRLMTPSEHMIEISEKDSVITAITAAGHQLRLDEQNQIIELKSGTTAHKLIFNMATGNALIEAPDTIKIKAPNIINEGNVTIDGNLVVNGSSTLGGISPVLTSGGPSATATA